jgi:hypothetical protein
MVESEIKVKKGNGKENKVSESRQTERERKQ